MSRKVLVIGHGIAGAAAAWRASDLGASVLVVSAGAGASVLSSGALDDLAWEDLVRAARTAGAELRARPLDDGVHAFADALGSWRIPRPTEPLPRLATLAGRTRPARGHDLSLLDLAAVPASGTVAVPRADRAAWDADSLSAFWNEDPFARARGLRFKPIDAALLRFEGEHRIADADLAARHDDPARIEWLADRLREAFARAHLTPSAVLLGPWLGASAPCAAALTARLGVPCGEALAAAGSPAGLRFARARDRLFERASIRVIARRVLAVSPPESADAARDRAPDAPRDSARAKSPESARERVPESVRLAPARAHITIEGDDTPLRADRLILACGGLTGGGLVYDPPDTHAGADMPARDAPAFRFSFEIAPSSDGRPYLSLSGARLGLSSSMFGPTLDATAWPTPGQTGTLESVGVAVDAQGLCASYMTAAGDVVESRPRTALVAVQTALRAAEWAAA